jgi:predicted Zn-dependent protease
MKRNPTLQEIVDKTAKTMFGTTLGEAQGERHCVACGCVADKFRDPLSEKEYSISGFCQKCQDKIFGKGK